MHEELETLIVEFDDATGIGRVTLDRPDRLNAMNEQMHEDLNEAFSSLSAIDEEADGAPVRVVVMEGTGDRAFSAGADISGFSERRPSDFSPRDFRDVMKEFPAPIVAKIDGYCLGGGLETALACDFRFASEDSALGLPEVNLGLIPGAAGVPYITQLAGPSVAKMVAMTGEHISAEQAAEWGIVNDWYPEDEFEEEVESFVSDLADQAPLAVRAIKDSANMAVESGLDEARLYDRRVFATLLETEDHEEGAAAFSEKREPEFEGK